MPSAHPFYAHVSQAGRAPLCQQARLGGLTGGVQCLQAVKEETTKAEVRWPGWRRGLVAGVATRPGSLSRSPGPPAVERRA